MRIFGWAADQGGCGYYRMGLPLSELGRRGHDIQVSTALTGYEKRADVIVGQRVCNPGASRTWQAWGALPTGQRPALVFELDDDLFNIDPANASAYRYYDYQRMRDLAQNIAVADVVTVSTEPLAEVVRAINPNVAVLQNVVDEALLEMPRATPPVGSGTVFGWAGSYNHQKDWPELERQLQRFLDRNADASFHEIGGEYLSGVRHTPWSESVEDYYRTVDFHVGVIPLAPSVFNRSKSAVKALEYAALKIPTVASNVGPYASFVVHGVTGLLVDHQHEWDRYLRELLRDPAKRARMGTLAHRKAQSWTIQGNYKRWERVYEYAAQ